MHADKTPTFCVRIPQVSPFFFIIYYFLSLSFPPVRLGSARRYWEACSGGPPHDESLFGQKIHIATSNENNSQFVDVTTLGNRDHTRHRGQSGATASLPIPHLSLMSTCIHSNKTPACQLGKKEEQIHYSALSETDTKFSRVILLL